MTTNETTASVGKVQVPDKVFPDQSYIQFKYGGIFMVVLPEVWDRHDADFKATHPHRKVFIPGTTAAKQAEVEDEARCVVAFAEPLMPDLLDMCECKADEERCEWCEFRGAIDGLANTLAALKGGDDE